MKISIPSQVMARTLGDETVLLDLASGTYFGLDSVGARMWELLSEGRDFSALCEVLLDEYEVERDELTRDLKELLAELDKEGLVSIESA